jgi:hypothetical protein
MADILRAYYTAAHSEDRAMSDYALNRVLYEQARAHKMPESIGPDEVAGYDLTPEERAALASGDLDALFRLGANPYLIRRVFRRRFAL